jgi:hypothetical protein
MLFMVNTTLYSQISLQRVVDRSGLQFEAHCLRRVKELSVNNLIMLFTDSS